MPRYKAKSVQPENPANILEAIKLIKIHKCPFRQAAAITKTSKSSLYRHISKLDVAGVDVASSSDNELLEIINNFTRVGAKSVSFFVYTFGIFESLNNKKKMILDFESGTGKDTD